MNEKQVKNRVGIFIVCSHFFVIVLTFMFFFASGFDFDEMTTIIGLVSPLFAGYTTVIISYIIKNRRDVRLHSSTVNTPYIFLSFLTPSIFVLLVLLLVVLQAWDIGFNNFNQFKAALTLIEGAFSVYVGQFIYSMFKSGK